MRGNLTREHNILHVICLVWRRIQQLTYLNQISSLPVQYYILYVYSFAHILTKFSNGEEHWFFRSTSHAPSQSPSYNSKFLPSRATAVTASDFILCRFDVKRNLENLCQRVDVHVYVHMLRHQNSLPARQFLFGYHPHK